ncbi:MAG: hypothetical protein M0Q13_03345 [Methanothrix sp.]|nr:hypothetical protein [Methanothrix sp.]
MIGTTRCRAIRIAKRPWIGPGFITCSESGEVRIGAVPPAGIRSSRDYLQDAELMELAGFS